MRKLILALIVIMLLAPSIVLSSEKYYKSQALSHTMLGLYTLADTCDHSSDFDTEKIKDEIRRYYIDQTGVFVNPVQGQLSVAINERRQIIEQTQNKEVYTAACDLTMTNTLKEYRRLSNYWKEIGILKPPELDIKKSKV